MQHEIGWNNAKAASSEYRRVHCPIFLLLLLLFDQQKDILLSLPARVGCNATFVIRCSRLLTSLAFQLLAAIGAVTASMSSPAGHVTSVLMALPIHAHSDHLWMGLFLLLLSPSLLPFPLDFYRLIMWTSKQPGGCFFFVCIFPLFMCWSQLEEQVFVLSVCLT